LKLGVNGDPGIHRSVPPDGKRLTLSIDGSSLYRGDNTLSFDRASPRSDQEPWMSVGRVEVKKKTLTQRR
jgi:hypothetical protein